MRSSQGLAAAVLLAALPLVSSAAEASYALTKVEFLNPDGTPRTKLPPELVQLRESIEKKLATIEVKAPPRYSNWVNEDAAYLITDRERAEFARLKTDEQRDQFVEQFWERHPSKEGHYRRLAYVNERFADSLPAWKTDRGRAYIVAGPPDEIESHPGDREVWKYGDVGGGAKLLLTFVFPK